MPVSYNLYCDESCHLENDKSKAMALGAIYCNKLEYRDFIRGISEIKKSYKISLRREIKWEKISPAMLDYYKDIVDFFFSAKGLFFRGLIVPDKGILDHKSRMQTHEDFYWKMYYEMLKPIFSRNTNYNIFIDIKDTHSIERSQMLKRVLQNTRLDFDGNFIDNVQIVRSNDVVLMQLTDLFIGALTFVHRGLYSSEYSSAAKKEVVNRIKERSGLTLEKTTFLFERKFNLLVWESAQK